MHGRSRRRSAGTAPAHDQAETHGHPRHRDVKIDDSQGQHQQAMQGVVQVRASTSISFICVPTGFCFCGQCGLRGMQCR